MADWLSSSSGSTSKAWLTEAFLKTSAANVLSHSRRFFLTLNLTRGDKGRLLKPSLSVQRGLDSFDHASYLDGVRCEGNVGQISLKCDQSVLVFLFHEVDLAEHQLRATQFRSTQATLVKALNEAGITPAVFHGELGWREKEEALDHFRTVAPVLVSTEAGGEGRNLQFCRVVVNYDLPWNPMRVEQRIGRVHRLGQAHPVRVINLAARGTIEAYVLEILDRKIRMFELVVGEMEEILGTWQLHGSFEDDVFRRWTESTNPRARKRRFTELAQHLMVARRLYQQQKDRQGWLFPGVEREER